MSSIIWNFASFIVALGILVTVHEFGHYWVARKCGVKVERFSIGFGKSLWRRIGKDGTEYTIALIPLGGYVKMLDGRVDDVPEELSDSAFDRKPLWKRAAIVAAGPAFNFLFAIFVLWLVYLIGISTVKPVIGEVTPQSIVAQAGLEPKMELKAISGVRTPDWESVNMEIISHIGERELSLTVSSDDLIGTEQEIKVNLSDWEFDPETESPMTTLGFTPFSPEIFTELGLVSDDGAAHLAGLLENDIIRSIDGVEIKTWQEIVDIVRGSPEKPLSLIVERDGQSRTLLLTPGARTLSNGDVIGFAGIAPKMAEWPEEYKIDLKFGPLESMYKAVQRTGQLIDLTATMLGKLISGDIGLNNLSGPISIAKGAGTTAGFGVVYFLSFLALISVNLGIINLVPLPMLDGGHLMFFAIEAVIKKPVSERIQEMGYRVGGAIIFSMMAIAIFNDFARL
ncbi:sigma E protease regulator RseP [Vibrio sp. WJH972]